MSEELRIYKQEQGAATVEAIKFKGEYFWLVGGDAIATPHQYLNFLENFAHLFPDGKVKQHGAVIGTEADIERLGEVDPLAWEEAEAKRNAEAQ